MSFIANEYIALINAFYLLCVLYILVFWRQICDFDVCSSGALAHYAVPVVVQYKWLKPITEVHLLVFSLKIEVCLCMMTTSLPYIAYVFCSSVALANCNALFCWNADLNVMRNVSKYHKKNFKQFHSHQDVLVYISMIENVQNDKSSKKNIVKHKWIEKWIGKKLISNRILNDSFPKTMKCAW